MEDTTNQAGTAVAEVTVDADQPSERPSSGASGQDWLASGPSEESQAFRALLSSGSRGVQTVTTRPDTAAPDGQSAPAGDEAPAAPERGADGRYIPRRGIPKAVAEAEQKVAELQAQLAERDPEKLRQQWERDQQAKTEASTLDALAQSKAAEVARYRDLLEKPDAELSAEDYQFREDFKERLRAVPEVEAAHRELARQTIESERQALSTKEVNFLNGIYDQVATLATKASIDPERWKAPGTTFAVMAEDYADARVSAREAEVRAEMGATIRRLEADNQQLRLTGPRGLAAARTGLAGGVSGGGGADALDDNAIFRRLLNGQPVN